MSKQIARASTFVILSAGAILVVSLPIRNDFDGVYGIVECHAMCFVIFQYWSAVLIESYFALEHYLTWFPGTAHIRWLPRGTYIILRKDCRTVDLPG